MNQGRKWTIFALLKIGELTSALILIVATTKFGRFMDNLLANHFNNPSFYAASENIFIWFACGAINLIFAGLLLWMLFFLLKEFCKMNIGWADSIEDKISRRKK